MDLLSGYISNNPGDFHPSMVYKGTWSFLFGICWDSKRAKSGEKRPLQTGKTSFIHRLLLTLIGIGLGLQSLAAVIIIILVFSLTFGYRIHVEEKLLISELNGEYIQYMTKTKRLIPYIL